MTRTVPQYPASVRGRRKWIRPEMPAIDDGPALQDGGWPRVRGGRCGQRAARTRAAIEAGLMAEAGQKKGNG